MKCSKHNKHSTLTVDIDYLGHKYTQVIYNWAKYLDPLSHDWCPANDVVSENIATYGFWEKYETALLNDIFSTAEKGSKFIDIGAQTGWYTLLAADSGLNVLAMEADENSAALIKSSASINGFRNIFVDNVVVDENLVQLPPTNIHAVKVDIEGNEKHALSLLDRSFSKKMIKYAIFEFSPTFDDSYEGIFEKLDSYGYKGYRIPTGDESWTRLFMDNPLKTLTKQPPVKVEDISSWEQENILFL